MQNVIRHTSLGDIIGREDDVCVRFRGIPYATAERFEYCVPVEHWEGALDALDGDVDCPQFATYRKPERPDDDFYTMEFYSEYPCRYAESPLTLNITAPKDARDLPVLLYIHGGGFETGRIGDLTYGPSDEYARRGIVQVSVGYRLNVFGLFRSRNYGLHDLVTAVKWVYAHIADFGGDPERITLMGQSAGAMSIMDLLYSDLLKGIVKGAVTMSGGGLMPKISSPLTEEESSAFWDKVRDGCGCATDEELKTADPELLWNTWYDLSRAKENYSPHIVVPGIDGEVIPAEPHELQKKGAILDVPMIIGVTSQDFMAPILYNMALSYAKWADKNGRTPKWCYFFDRTLPGNLFKAYHSCDHWYMFGCMDQSWRTFEEKDYALAKLMMDHVAAFVKTGDPNFEGAPEWKPVGGKNRGFRRFDGESDGYAYPGECYRKTIHTFLFDKGPM